MKNKDDFGNMSVYLVLGLVQMQNVGNCFVTGGSTRKNIYNKCLHCIICFF